MSDKKEENTKEKEPKAPEEKFVQTQHSVVINGEEIRYTATAGTLLLQEEKDEKDPQPKAMIFYVAYTRDGVEDVSGRPLTFSFNGGPGSSSVWLHMGTLGPRRIYSDNEAGTLSKPPYKLVDNEFSILDKTDLVFIDPVSTGFSRAVAGEKAKQFHDFKKDIESVGNFIRLFMTRNNRWGSPKFLIGESYGTTRAAGLSGYLQSNLGMYLNGAMLISSVLNFQTLRFAIGNDLPHIFFLPSFAATAWYHKRLDDELQADLRKTLDEVEAFAEGAYASALMKGSKLTGDERAEVAAKLARYTGLSLDYVERTNLRISIHRFVKELRRDERVTVGRLDSRFVGRDRDAAGEHYETDPSYSTILGPYTATFNDYVRRELAFESDLPYEILTGRVHPWSYDKHQNEYVNVAETLRKAMSMNPFLKVFVANGYFDLATPYFATEYTFNHLQLEPELEKNISMAYYEAGHMMYVHLPSLAQLKDDLDAFIVAAM